MNEEEANHALAIFRERYFNIGAFENKLYDGIVPMLEQLKKLGKRMAVATSKNEVSAVRILEHFQIASYFEVIGGDCREKERNTKAKVVAYVLEQLQAKAEDAVMVGDRNYDVEGAHSLGMPCIGVLYGYGSREEFDACGADQVAQTPADVVKLFA